MTRCAMPPACWEGAASLYVPTQMLHASPIGDDKQEWCVDQQWSRSGCTARASKRTKQPGHGRPRPIKSLGFENQDLGFGTRRSRLLQRFAAGVASPVPTRPGPMVGRHAGGLERCQHPAHVPGGESVHLQSPPPSREPESAHSGGWTQPRGQRPIPPSPCGSDSRTRNPTPGVSANRRPRDAS